MHQYRVHICTHTPKYECLELSNGSNLNVKNANLVTYISGWVEDSRPVRGSQGRAQPYLTSGSPGPWCAGQYWKLYSSLSRMSCMSLVPVYLHMNTDILWYLFSVLLVHVVVMFLDVQSENMFLVIVWLMIMDMRFWICVHIWNVVTR